MISLTSQSDQVLQVYYFDPLNQEQVIDLPPHAAMQVGLPLHPNTQALLASGALISGTSYTPSPAQSYPFQGKPLVWAGDWRPGAFYQIGMAVIQADKLFIAATNHASQTPPTLSDPNWVLAALLDVNAFFDFELSMAPPNSLPVWNGTGWDIRKVADSDVNLTSAAISDLPAVLAPYLLKAGGIMTGPVVLSADPTVPLHAATKQYVDLHLPLTGGTLSGALVLAGPPTVALHAATKAYVDLHLPKTGGILTGALTLAGAPINSLHAATKAYVDLHLPRIGGTVTGPITYNGPPTVSGHLANKAYVDLHLPLAGGTMIGPVVLAGAPAAPLHAATKAYVDLHLPLAGGTMTGPVTGAHGLVPASGGTMTGYLVLSGNAIAPLHPVTLGQFEAALDPATGLALLRSGGTMTGDIVLAGPPSQPLHATTKAYVDLHLPRDGTAAMTGQLPLATLALSSPLSGTGLYQTAGAPAWCDAELQTNRFQPAYSGGTLSAPYNLVRAHGVTPFKIGATAARPTLTATFNSGPTECAVATQQFGDLLNPGDLVLGYGQERFGAVRGARSRLCFSFDPPDEESDDQLELTLRAFTSNYVTAALASVADGGSGTINLQVADGSQFSIGKALSVSGTADYDGTYTILNIAGNLLNVSGTYTTSQTGWVGGSKLSPAAGAVTLSLSDSPIDPAPVSALNATVSATGATSVVPAAPSLSVLTGAELVVGLHNVADVARDVWLHVIPHDGAAASRAESPFTDVARHTATLLAMTNVDSLASVTVADTTGFEEGDSVVLTDTASHNGPTTVIAIMTAPPRLLLDTLYTGAEVAGTVTNLDKLKLTASGVGLEEGDTLLLAGATAFSGPVVCEVVHPASPLIVASSAQVGVGGLSGHYRTLAVRRLRFTNDDSDSSSSSSSSSSGSSGSSNSSSSSSSS